MKVFISLTALIFLLVFNLYGQTEPDYREMFLEAESYFLFEEYNEALPLYLRLNNKFPDNNNISYKVGICYLNNSYEKAKAIDYLQKASKSINLKYKDNQFKETGAPLDALFYLGNAYRINDQLDRAITTYNKFKKMCDPEIYDIALVDEQILACEHARELKTRPIDIDIVNLGDRINTRFSDVDPVLSGDENKLVYIQKQQFYDAVFYSEKIDGAWSYPRNIIPELGVDEDAYPTCLSYDGTELYIYRSDNFIGDLYKSKLVNGLWSPLTKLNDNINTKYWESHACLTRNSDTLYFTSNRKDTYGGLDIYYSTLDDRGDWGKPTNMGPLINTIYNEETPFITYDGKTLYFSSYGHFNMGGYDVFYSSLLDNGKWSAPINAGYPINTSDDDIFFVPVQNGNFAYFPRFMDDTYGRTDIYRIEIYTSTHPRKFKIRGLVSLPAESFLTKPVTIKIIEHFSRDTVAVTYADIFSGEFSFTAPAGQYDILIVGEEIVPKTSTVIVPKDYVDKEFEMKSEILLTLVKKFEEVTTPRIVDKIELSDTLILVSKDTPLKIHMNLERDADLYVGIYHDSLFAGADTFHITRRRFTYEFKPLPGKNILKLKLVDSEGNLSFAEVVVIFTPPVTGPVSEVVPKDTSVIKPVPSDAQLVQDLVNELMENADSNLKQFLGQLDPVEIGISSESELIDYLKKNATAQGYSTQDVYDLVLLSLQYKYVQSYLDQLIELSDDENLTAALVKINLKELKINSLQELYDHLLSLSDEYGYDSTDLNDLFSILSMRSELLQLITDLSQLAEGDLKYLLEELDPESAGLHTPVDLIKYLITSAYGHDYTEVDAMTLLFEYLETEDLKEIMKILISSAGNGLRDYLLVLNLESEGIKSISDLYNHLLNQAKFQNYTEQDVITLFLNLLNYLENETLIRPVEPPPPPVSTGHGYLAYILAGAGMLIILFILFYRRKKNKKKATTE